TMNIGTGDLSMAGTSTVMASGSTAITVGQGDLALSGTTLLNSGGNFTANVGTGDLSMAGSSTVVAGNNLLLTIGTGQVDLNGQTTLAAGTNLDLQVDQGNVNLRDDATLSAHDTVRLDIARQGGLVMADARTLVDAGRAVVIRTVDSILLDLIRAGDSVSLTSVQGAILDNTQTEQNLIVTSELNLSAAHGIGLPWKDNLNVDVQVVNALNTVDQGINLQNRKALAVGDQGVSNLGTGDVVLTAGGAITQHGLRYQRHAGGAGLISNLPGQRIYVISNLSGVDLDAQWGNLTPQLTSRVTTHPRPFDLRSALSSRSIPDTEVLGDSALLRLREAQDSDQGGLLSRPIQIASQARLLGSGQILPALGLTGVAWPDVLPSDLPVWQNDTSDRGPKDGDDMAVPTPSSPDEMTEVDGLNWLVNEGSNTKMKNSSTSTIDPSTDDFDTPLVAHGVRLCDEQKTTDHLYES
ncbi:hypothetical protein, partial [Sphaerotilus sp.]|uniref:hypothetical protein n=1 Tax=Sphaerotilus sp. TaxID=2093942 RepID=UPI0034E1BEDA